MSTTPPGYNPIDLPGQILDEGYGGRFTDPTSGAGLFTANTDYNVVGVDPLTGEDAPIGTDVGFGAAVRRWMQAGVYNGDFSILPNAYGDHIIDAYNMLAYWSFQPTQSGCIVAYAEPQSAVAFQADTFQTDAFQATAGSGGASQLRFKMIAGGYAEDDAHIQQLVPVATTADEVYELEAGFSLVRVQDTDPDAKAYITVEFVQGNLLASTASPNSVTIEASLATDSKATTRTDTITIPDDARYARISVGMRRGAAVETETAEFSISEVFIETRYIAAIRRGAPAGLLAPFAGTTTPDGWLACDGTSYSTTTYADLFAAIGYTYGGSGANFNVPDLTGRVVVGQDTGDADFDTLGETGGAKTHTHGAGSYSANAQGAWYNIAPGATYQDPPYNHTHTIGGTSASGSQVQPYMALPYIIKT